MNPLSFLLEKLAKYYLKDIFEEDYLNLDYLSLINTSISFKNIKLKKSFFDKHVKFIEVLTGMIDEINLEYSIVEGTITINIIGINLNLLMTQSNFNEIDNYLHKIKQVSINQDIENQSFSFFTHLKNLANIIINVKSINISVYFDFFTTFIQTSLYIEEISIKNKNYDNNSDAENFISWAKMEKTKSFAEINGKSILIDDLSLSILTINKKEIIKVNSIEKIANLINEKNYNSDRILEISVQIELYSKNIIFSQVSQSDFTKLENKIMSIVKKTKNKQSSMKKSQSSSMNNLLSNNELTSVNENQRDLDKAKSNEQVSTNYIDFSSEIWSSLTDCNIGVYLSIPTIKLVLNKRSISSINKLTTYINLLFSINNEKRELRKKKLLNCLNTIKQLRKNGDSSFVEDLPQKNVKRNFNSEPELFLWLNIYIFLKMIQLKYITFKINIYLLNLLIVFYKEKVNQNLILIIDDQLSKNIHYFLESFSINKVNNNLMTTKEISLISNKLENKRVKDFIIFLIKRIFIIKEEIDNKTKTEVYIKIGLDINKTIIIVNNTFSGKHKDQKNKKKLIKNIMYMRYKYYNKSDNFEDLPTDYLEHNTLMEISIDNIGFNLYSNLNNILFTKLLVNKLEVNEKFNDKKMLFPIIKCHSQINSQFYIINSTIINSIVDLPLVSIFVDPYAIYFHLLFYDDCILKNKSFLENVTGSQDFEFNKKTDQDVRLKLNKFQFNVGQIVINFNSNSFNKLDYQRSNIVCLSDLYIGVDHKLSNHFELYLSELIFGSVYQKNLLSFNNLEDIINFENIMLSIYDIGRTFDYKKLVYNKTIEIPFPDIYLKVRKTDIELIFSYLSHLKLLNDIFPIVRSKEIQKNIISKTNNNVILLDNTLIYRRDSLFSRSRNNSFELKYGGDIQMLLLNKKNKDSQKLISYYIINFNKLVIELSFKDKHIKNQSNKEPNNTNNISNKKVILMLEKIYIFYANFSKSYSSLVNIQKIVLYSIYSENINLQDKVKSSIVFQVANSEFFYAELSVEKLKEILQNKLSNLNNLSIGILSNKNETKVNVNIPNLTVNFNPDFVNFLCNFLNFNKNLSLIEDINEIKERLSNLSDMYFNFNLFSKRTKRKNLSLNYIKNMKKMNTDFNLNLQDFKVIFYFNSQVLFDIQLGDLLFIYNSEEIIINAEILKFDDIRNNTNTNKNILINNNQNIINNNFNKPHLKISFNLKENEFNLKIFSVKVCLLNRLVLDIIEYFYFILCDETFVNISNVFGTEIEKIFPKKYIISKGKKCNVEIKEYESKILNSDRTENVSVTIKIEKKEELEENHNDKKPLKLKSNKRRENLYTGSLEVLEDYEDYKKIKGKNSKIRSNFRYNLNNDKKSSNKLNHANVIGDIKEESKKLRLNISIYNSEIHLPMNSLKSNERLVFIFSELNIQNPQNVYNNTSYCSNTKSFSYNEVDRSLSDLTDFYFDQYINCMKRVDNDKKIKLNKLDYLISCTEGRIYNGSNTNDRICFIDFNKTIINNVNHLKGSSLKNTTKLKFNMHFQNQDESIKEISEIHELGSFHLLIDITDKTKQFSLSKIFLLIPELKARLFNDLYEKLLRVIFENLGEESTIRSKMSTWSKAFIKEHWDEINFKNIEFGIFISKAIIQINNFNSTCLNHIDEKDKGKVGIINIHGNKFNCEVGSIELDKLMSLNVNDLFFTMKFNLNKTKETHISIGRFSCILNKAMSCFNKLNNIEFISPSNKCYLEDDMSDLNLKINIINLPHGQSEYNFQINNIRLEFNQLAFLLLNDFFTRYFNYYQNTKVINIDHKLSMNKNIKLAITNCQIGLVSMRENYASLNELLFELDIIIEINNSGNSMLGPFNSNKTFEIYLKSINFLDYIKKKENLTKNQITGSSLFIININSNTDETMSMNERDYCLVFRQLTLNHNNSNSSLKGIEFVKSTENTGKKLILDYSYDSFKEKIELLTYSEADYVYNYFNTNNPSNRFEIQLNMVQVQLLKKMFSEVQNYNNEFYSKVFWREELLKFNEIKYKSMYSLDLNQTSIIISDSNFNSKLFQIEIINSLGLYSVINNKILKQSQERKVKQQLMKSSNKFLQVANYSYNKYGDNDIEIVKLKQINDENNLLIPITECLCKIIFKVSYFDNSKLLWEPFIEPCPVFLNMLSSQISQNINIIIDNLTPIDIGLKKLVRQTHTHSLNININEILFENLRNILLDFNKYSDQNKINEEVDDKLRKKLIIRNITDFYINIVNENEFKEKIEENSTKAVLFYKNSKSIDIKEEIIVSYHPKDIGNLIAISKEHKIDDDGDNKKDIQNKNKKLIKLKSFGVQQNNNNINSQETSSPGAYTTTRFLLNNQISIKHDTIKSINSEKSFSPTKLRQILNYDDPECVMSMSIEKTQKIFSILSLDEKTHKRKQNINVEELRKNFNDNFSILLNKEHILVIDMALDIESNTKSLTFRSNQGIKNDLDFPIQIGIVLKEGFINSEERIILFPGCVYNLPISLISKISDLKLKPYFFDEKGIHFSSGIFPINESFSLDEKRAHVISCYVKYLYPEDKSQYKEFYFTPSVDFMITTKFVKEENDSYDTNIKKRIEIINDFTKFKGLVFEQAHKSRIDNIIGDVIYTLSPIYKIYNSLPREISIKKRINSANTITYKNDNKQSQLDIAKTIEVYFDIDLFIKNFSNSDFMDKRREQYGSELLNSECLKKENIIKSIHRDDLSSIIISDSNVTIKPIGDYLSLYEPFSLQKTYFNHTFFEINVSEYQLEEVELALTNRIHKKDKKGNKKKTTTFITLHPKHYYEIKPFNLKILRTLEKTMDSTKRTKNYYIKFTENKNYFTQTKQLWSKNINSPKLSFYTEKDEFNTIKAYIYCSYLFINPSGIDLQLEDTERSIKYDFSYICENKEKVLGLDKKNYDLRKVKMFTPSDKKIFKFILSYQEKDKIENKHQYTNSLERNDTVLQVKDEESNKQKEVNSLKINIEEILSKPKLIEIKSNKNFLANYLLDENKENFFAKYISSNLNIYNKNYSKIPNFNQNIIEQSIKKEKIILSIQSKSLTNELRFSKLIFITPQLYIHNTTKKDIYLYYINNDLGFVNFGECIRENKIVKIHYLEDYFDFFKFSYEDKPSSDSHLYSALVKFVKNQEFYLKINEKEKESVLLYFKVYEVYGFLYVIIKEKYNLSDYPYFICNNLNLEIKYKQKEFLEKDIKKYSETTLFYSHITERILVPFKLHNDKNDNTTSYSWDEPFMRNKQDKNILEISFFGTKFEVDLNDIHEDIKFDDKFKRQDEDMILIKDKVISKGTLSVVNNGLSVSKKEYTYHLYEFGLILQGLDNSLIRCNFYEKQTECYRTGSGRIVLKNKNNNYEMFCISNDETNYLNGKITDFIERAQKFAEVVVIKRKIFNNSIYLEIDKKTTKNVISCGNSINFNFCVSNINLSLIQKGEEFMFIWIRDVLLSLNKNDSEYKNISIKIKDYQIDQFIENAYYPILLSPLLDPNSTNLDNSHDTYNVNIEFSSLKLINNFYQIDKIYIGIDSIDLRLEYKIIEKLFSYINTLNLILYREKNKIYNTGFLDIIDNISNSIFLSEKIYDNNETLLLVKQIYISDIKCSFSIKFDNIDLFLENEFLVFLKPLIEELGLKILNIDSNMFNLMPFARNNIFQSKDELFSKLSSFYYNQIISELIKSFGGLDSITNFHLMDNINRNILNNIRENRLELSKTKNNKKQNQIIELYHSSFLRLTVVVSGMFFFRV